MLSIIKFISSRKFESVGRIAFMLRPRMIVLFSIALKIKFLGRN